MGGYQNMFSRQTIKIKKGFKPTWATKAFPENIKKTRLKVKIFKKGFEKCLIKERYHQN